MVGERRNPEANQVAGSPPVEARVAWISTRRATAAADGIASNLAGRYVLHDVMGHGEAPLQELSTAHLVMIEAPPIVAPRFDHDFLTMVQNTRALGP